MFQAVDKVVDLFTYKQNTYEIPSFNITRQGM